MVQRLKTKVEELKQELALATGEERTEELTEEELDSCRKLVDQYLEDKDPDTKIQVIYSRLLCEVLSKRLN